MKFETKIEGIIFSERALELLTYTVNNRRAYNTKAQEKIKMLLKSSRYTSSSLRFATECYINHEYCRDAKDLVIVGYNPQTKVGGVVIFTDYKGEDGMFVSANLNPIGLEKYSNLPFWGLRLDTLDLVVSDIVYDIRMQIGQ